MSAVLTDPPLTFEAYMAWEAEQAERHEFLGGEVFAMTGARATHNTIALNIALALRDALRGTSCRVFIADMKLQVAPADASFYPDVFVSCDPRDRTPDAELVQRHPKLVVEVLSDSTAAFDRGRKFEAYRALDSLEAYLLVEQHRPHADLFLRNAVGRVEAASPRAAGGGSRAAQRVRQNATRYGATHRIRRARPPPYDPNIGKEWRPDVRTRTGHSGTSIRHMARRGREVVLSVTKQRMLV